MQSGNTSNFTTKNELSELEILTGHLHKTNLSFVDGKITLKLDQLKTLVESIGDTLLSKPLLAFKDDKYIITPNNETNYFLLDGTRNMAIKGIKFTDWLTDKDIKWWEKQNIDLTHLKINTHTIDIKKLSHVEEEKLFKLFVHESLYSQLSKEQFEAQYAIIVSSYTQLVQSHINAKFKGVLGDNFIEDSYQRNLAIAKKRYGKLFNEKLENKIFNHCSSTINEISHIEVDLDPKTNQLIVTSKFDNYIIIQGDQSNVQLNGVNYYTLEGSLEYKFELSIDPHGFILKEIICTDPLLLQIFIFGKIDIQQEIANNKIKPISPFTYFIKMHQDKIRENLENPNYQSNSTQFLLNCFDGVKINTLNDNIKYLKSHHWKLIFEKSNAFDKKQNSQRWVDLIIKMASIDLFDQNGQIKPEVIDALGINDLLVKKQEYFLESYKRNLLESYCLFIIETCKAELAPSLPKGETLDAYCEKFKNSVIHALNKQLGKKSQSFKRKSVKIIIKEYQRESIHDIAFSIEKHERSTIQQKQEKHSNKQNNTLNTNTSTTKIVKSDKRVFVEEFKILANSEILLTENLLSSEEELSNNEAQEVVLRNNLKQHIKSLIDQINPLSDDVFTNNEIALELMKASTSIFYHLENFFKLNKKAKSETVITSLNETIHKTRQEIDKIYTLLPKLKNDDNLNEFCNALKIYTDTCSKIINYEVEQVTTNEITTNDNISEATNNDSQLHTPPTNNGVAINLENNPPDGLNLRINKLVEELKRFPSLEKDYFAMQSVAYYVAYQMLDSLFTDKDDAYILTDNDIKALHLNLNHVLEEIKKTQNQQNAAKIIAITDSIRNAIRLCQEHFVYQSFYENKTLLELKEKLLYVDLFNSLNNNKLNNPELNLCLYNGLEPIYKNLAKEIPTEFTSTLDKNILKVYFSLINSANGISDKTKAADLILATKALSSAQKVLKSPHDAKYLTDCINTGIELTKHPRLKKLGGYLLCLAGCILIAASIAAFVTTCAVAFPVALGGLKLAAILIAAGFASLPIGTKLGMYGYNQINFFNHQTHITNDGHMQNGLEDNNQSKINRSTS